MTDYYRLAEAELKQVNGGQYNQTFDAAHLGKAEVYAKLAHAQAVRESCKCTGKDV